MIFWGVFGGCYVVVACLARCVVVSGIVWVGVEVWDLDVLGSVMGFSVGETVGPYLGVSGGGIVVFGPVQPYLGVVGWLLWLRVC